MVLQSPSQSTYSEMERASQQFIASRQTQPLAHVSAGQYTFAQLRQRCHLSTLDVARATGVRYVRVYRMEHNLACRFEDIVTVLRFLSQCLGCELRMQDIVGLQACARGTG